MKHRGRQFLTRMFMLMTGGIIASLIIGGVYFLLDPSFSVKKVFVVPLLMIAADLMYRIFTLVDVARPLGALLRMTGISSLLEFTIKTGNSLYLWHILLIPKRFITYWFKK